jgi:hypothetical protein
VHGNRLNTICSTEAHSFSQAPPLSCCHLVQKQLALLCAFEINNALTAHLAQCSKLREMEYWNGTVPNVAYGMIPVCMEFVHVLLQRSVVAGAKLMSAVMLPKSVQRQDSRIFASRCLGGQWSFRLVS